MHRNGRTYHSAITPLATAHEASHRLEADDIQTHRRPRRFERVQRWTWHRSTLQALALMLTAGALLLGIARTTEAQVATPTYEIWSATLTVGETTDTLTKGYDAVLGIGSLSKTSFSYAGSQYTVRRLIVNNLSGTYHLRLSFDKAWPHDSIAVIDVGATVDAPLPVFTDSGFGTQIVDNVPTTWAENDTLTVKILAGPEIQSVALTSTPTGRSHYAIDDTVTASVRFSHEIAISGTPQLTLDIGGANRTADCASTDVGTTLACSYTITASDSAPNGIGINANNLAFNGGWIRQTNAMGVGAAITHQAVTRSLNHRVDHPGAVRNLTAYGTFNKVALRWEQPAYLGAGGQNAGAFVFYYEYQQKTGSADWEPWQRASDGASPGLVISGLTNETIYRFRVRAVTWNARGRQSADVSATPTPRFRLSVPRPYIVRGEEGTTVTMSITDGYVLEQDVTFNLTWYGDPTNDGQSLLHAGNPTTITVRAGNIHGSVELKARADDDSGIQVSYHEPITRDLIAKHGTATIGTTLFSVHDNEPAPTMSLSGPAQVNEGETFTVSLTKPMRTYDPYTIPIKVGNPNRVTLEVKNPFHLRGPIGKTNTLRQSIGSTSLSQTIEIEATDDGIKNGDREVTFQIQRSSTDPWRLGTQSLTVTVRDVTPAGTATIRAISNAANESGDPNKNAKLNIGVVLSKAVNQTVTVDYRTADGDAIAGTDYVAKNGTLTFAPNEVRKDIRIDIHEDRVGDHQEKFRVWLESPTGPAVLTQFNWAIGTIYDETPTFVVHDASAHESGDTTDSSMRFKVDLRYADEDATANVTVAYATVSGTAQAVSDYTHTFGTLTFAPGDPTSQIVSVPVKDDGVEDSGETFLLVLSNPRGGAQLHVSKSTATGTILNTEDAALQASFPDSTSKSSSHSGTDDRPQVIVTFSEAVTTIAADTPSVTVTGGTVASVQAHTEDGLSNAWMFFLNPEGNDDVTFTLLADAACASGGICTAGGAPLSQVPSARTITGPEQTVDPTLSAIFKEIPAAHDGEDNFTFEVEFNEAPDVGYQRMRDHAFTVTRGSVKSAKRISPPSNLEWEITIEPTANDAVTIALKTTADCTASDAICTSAGTPLTAVPGALTIAGPEEDDDDTPVEPVTNLTASFNAMPSEHGGPGKEFTFELTFSESPAAGYAKLRDHAFSVSGGDVRSARRLQQGTNIGWRITVKPDAGEWGNITIRLPGGRACNSTGAICTSDGRQLSNSPSTTVRGPAALSVADASADENNDDTLDFVVSLDRASTLTVTVDYATSNGTATAGSDYTATSGTLTFDPGDVTETVSVPILDDAIDDGGETMTFTLSNASNARIADGTATGTIENSDPLQQAWIARFGRTVASEVVDGITDRLASPRGGSHVRIGGISLEQNGSAWTETPVDDEAEIGTTIENARTMTGQDLLMQSAFRLQSESDGPGGTAWTAWGRFSRSSFEGKVDGVELSGDVTTGLLGADVGTNEWTAGVALSAAKGDGPFALIIDKLTDKRSSPGSGTISSRLTSVHPYVQVQATDRLALWAIGGYGTGEMTIAKDRVTALPTAHRTPINTDIDMMMAAVGTRGTVLDTAAGDALDLVLKSDALWLTTTSDATWQMAGAEATVSRLRLIVDASRGFEVGAGGTLTPSIEAGVRARRRRR